MQFHEATDSFFDGNIINYTSHFSEKNISKIAERWCFGDCKNIGHKFEQHLRMYIGQVEKDFVMESLQRSSPYGYCH